MKKKGDGVVLRFRELSVEGVFLIEPEKLLDNRGFFARLWCRKELSLQGIDFEPVQCNTSFNEKAGTLRGIHYQVEPHSEAKLVACLQGAISDIVVDIRKGSATYGRCLVQHLSACDGRLLYVPKGCAHGYLTTEDDSTAVYLATQYHNPQSSRGIRWDDPRFGIVLPHPVSIISEKDMNWQDFRDE